MLIRADGRQELLIGRGEPSVRISIDDGSVLDGPVTLRFSLAGTQGLDTQLLALRRFFWLQEPKRWPQALAPARARLVRHSLILRTLDALAVDGRHRSVARAIFGEERVAADWESGSGYLRSSVRRLIACARHLAEGGYEEMLAKG